MQTKFVNLGQILQSFILTMKYKAEIFFVCMTFGKLIASKRVANKYRGKNYNIFINSYEDKYLKAVQR